MNDEQLRFENWCVLGTVQALFGQIRPTMRAITLDADYATRYVNLHFAVSEPLDEEILLDLSGEVNAVLGDVDGDALADQWVGEEWWTQWPHREARPIYAAKVDHPEDEE